MKITFILPAVGKKENKKYIKTWKMEPLTIAVLNAITPKKYDREFFDDRIEHIDYETDTDVVAISVETYSAKRAYNIAKKFQKRNIPVIMGGYHPTLCTDEVLNHADSVVTGNAEEVWEHVLLDIEQKKLKKLYTGSTKYVDILPDRSIYEDKKYSPLTLIETSRGCKHNCDFCSITSFYKQKFIRRPINNIVEEIKKARYKFIFFVDDNIFNDTEYLKKLLKALIPLKIKWASQGTLTCAKDDELLYLIKKSGCKMVLIGFESLNEKTLNLMNKKWSYKLGERDHLIKKIHNSGVNIYATFVCGYEDDTKKTVDLDLNFSQKHNFFFAAFNHLLPFPGTRIYKKLNDNSRIIEKKWWLSENYKYGDVAFNPVKMTSLELSDFCKEAREKFFNLSSIIKRGVWTFIRSKSLYILIIFFIQNLNLKNEVNQKMGLPLGKGLDYGEK